jgi:hypothetical protein
LRRTQDHELLEADRRDRLLVQRRQPGLERVRQQRRRVRQHEQQAGHAATIVQQPCQRRQHDRVGPVKGVFAAAQAARAVEDDERSIGTHTAGFERSAIDRNESPQRGGDGFIGQHHDLREDAAGKRVFEHRGAERATGPDHDRAPRHARDCTWGLEGRTPSPTCGPRLASASPSRRPV